MAAQPTISTCKLSGCEKSVKDSARDVCATHYTRLRRYGTYELPGFQFRDINCAKCGENFRNTHKGGLRKYCDKCLANKHLIYGNSKWSSTEKGREYSRIYFKKLKHELKTKVFNHYGWHCNCCNETIVQFLTVDHVNGGGSKERREDYVHGVKLYKKIIESGFSKEYQILCMNCNFGKKITGGICPHNLQ